MASNTMIEEVFATLDRDKKGSLPTSQLGLAIRALGKNPNETEMKELLKEAGDPGNFDLAKFKTLYSKCRGKSPQDQEREMRNAFQSLDVNGNSLIHEQELRQILGNLGDALNPQEVNALMREAGKDAKGNIDYNAFVDMLVNAYPVGDALGSRR
eukprot:TRINITY_DN1188_c0_g1_i1.p2 TRINITY_DN1188_c0_g1~~TRINITY_DN1188_c0_g1_i1.p2  ORF type:complete len:155 (-),score=49.04 TRINITY_DN1188_c0_g1_i1:91-555(-)